MSKEKTTKKDLKKNATDIHGKDYVLVKDRVKYFNDNYDNGQIQTEIVNILREDTKNPTYIVKATVYPNVEEGRKFVGHSQARVDKSDNVNKDAALENAETSAVGRALAFMDIGVIDSIASKDEVEKSGVDKKERPASDKQKEYIKDLIKEKGEDMPDDDWFEDLTSNKASKAIERLQDKPDKDEEDVPVVKEDSKVSVDDVDLPENGNKETDIPE